MLWSHKAFTSALGHGSIDTIRVRNLWLSIASRANFVEFPDPISTYCLGFSLTRTV